MDVAKLKAILEVLKGTDVSQLQWEDGEEKLTIRLGHPPAAVHTVAAPTLVAAQLPAPGANTIPTPASVTPVPSPPVAPPVPEGKKTFTVNSPFVGTFYRSSSPDSASFVEVGQTVKKGQVLCIVEAMKLMNEIEGEQPGKLVEVLIQNGSPVEYGEPLFRFEPL